MSKDKHIEEKHELSESIYMSGHGLDWKDSDDIAEQLYHEGYRKQSEGEWIVTKTEYGWNCAEYPVEYTCSVCGRIEKYAEPYCPNCGAKMKGGAEQ